MTCAYDELYLPCAQRMMGDMFDYAVNTLSVDIGNFNNMFLVSDVSKQVATGNPMYIAGMNGCEVAREVMRQCGEAVKILDERFEEHRREISPQ